MKELAERIRNNKKTLLYFHNNACGHCKEIKPKIDLLESKNKGDLFMVNTFEQEDITTKFKVEFVPTLVIIENEEVTKLEGFKKIEEFYEDDTRSNPNPIRG